MENKIIALEAQLEMNNELVKSEYRTLIALVEATIKEYITDPYGAVLTRKQLRTGLWDEIEIMFEVGFHNVEENRIDFGSDVWFEYNTKKNELAINYGTIGNYTKSNIYQVKRVNLVAGIFANIAAIESAFAAIAERANSGKYREYLQEEYKIEAEISQAKKTLKAQQLKAIEYSLKEGDAVKYSKSVRCRDQLFNTNSGAWTIHRICEKTIKVKSPLYGEVRQFPKERIIALISQGYLLVNTEEEENVNE